MDELLELFSDVEFEKSAEEIEAIINDARLLYNSYIQNTYNNNINIKKIKKINKEIQILKRIQNKQNVKQNEQNEQNVKQNEQNEQENYTKCNLKRKITPIKNSIESLQDEIENIQYYLEEQKKFNIQEKIINVYKELKKIDNHFDSLILIDLILEIEEIKELNL